MKKTSAYILIETLPGKSLDLIEAAKAIPEVKEIHLVTGPYDVIARVEAEDLKMIGEMMVKKVRATGFVARTVTCIVVEE